MKKRKLIALLPRFNKFNKQSKGIYGYYPINDAEDINIEPITQVRIMKQIQVELLKPVEFHGMFGLKTYEKGIHSLDCDLAKLLVRVKSARFIIPHKEAPAAKASRH